MSESNDGGLMPPFYYGLGLGGIVGGSWVLSYDWMFYGVVVLASVFMFAAYWIESTSGGGR